MTDWTDWSNSGSSFARSSSVISGTPERLNTHGTKRLPPPSSMTLPAQRATFSSAVITSKQTGQRMRAQVRYVDGPDVALILVIAELHFQHDAEDGRAEHGSAGADV